MSVGFVSVPVVPTFEGMSKAFADRLEKPARESGARAGKSISDGLNGAVQNLERQVKASSAKFDDLDRAYEKARGKQKVRETEEAEAKKTLARLEAEYAKAVADGSKITESAHKALSAARVKAVKASNDLRDAEVDATVAERKRKEQLDDLNKTYEKLGDAQAELSSEAGKSKGAFEKLRAELYLTQDELDSTAVKTSTLSEKLISGLGKIGTGVLLGAGAKIGSTITEGIGTAFSKGFGRLQSLENAEASLRGLGRSAEDIELIMGSVSQAVKGTAFGLDEAAQSAATFSTLGVKSGEDMDRVMTLLADTTAQSGKDLSEISPIMQKIVAAGGLTTDTFDQLNERATGVGEALSKKLGVPIEEVRDLAKDVDFETFAAAMEDNIGGAAQKSGETFGNAFGNMQAALGRLGEKFLAPAFALGPEVFGAIGGAVDKLGESIEPVLTALTEKLQPHMEDFAQHLGPWLESTIEGISSRIKFFVGWLQENRKWLEAVAVSTGILASGIAVMAFQSKLAMAGGFLKWVQTWTVVTKAQTVAQNALNFAMRMSGIGLVVTAVAALAGGLVWLFSKTEAGRKMWESFTSALVDGWERVTGKFSYGIELVQVAWQELTAAFSGGDWGYGALAEIIGAEHAEWLVNVVGNIKGAWEELVIAFTGGDWGYGALSEIIGADKAEWLVNAVGSVKDAWEELTEAFNGGDWGYGALSQIFGEDNAESIVNFVAELGERFIAFKEAVSQAFGDILAAAEPVLTWLYEFTKDQLGETLLSLWETLKDVGGAFFDIAQSVGGALWDALTSIWEIFKALWDVLSPLLIPVLKIVGGIVGGVLVGAFLALVGGIRVAAEVIELFAGMISWLMETFLAPLISIIGDLIGWIGDRLAGTITAFGDLWSNIFGAIGLIWDGWTDLLKIGMDFIVATVFGGLGAGLDVLRNSFSTAVDAIGKIWDGLKQAAMAPVKFVVDTVWNNGLLNAINAVTKFIGMDKIEPIQIGFDRGGILPGYSRMADGDDQLVPMRRGEGVLVSEGLKDPVSRELFLSANEWAKNGGSFASFIGEVGAGKATGGIINYAGSLTDIQESHARFVGRFFPDLFALTSASRSEPGSMHDYSRGAATDWQAQDGQYASQMPTAGSKALARAIATNFPNTAQLIHWPEDGWTNILNGGPFDYGAGTNAQHGNHVHWGTNSPLVFDGDDIVLTDAPGGASGSGGGFVKGIWDKIVNAIDPYPDQGEGWFSQVPGKFIESSLEKLWDFISEKVSSIFSFSGGGGGEGATQWADLASQALARMGYGDEHLDAMLQQIQIESTGDPNAVNMWDSNAMAGHPSGGLLQVIEPTYRDVRNKYPEAFEGLPDDRFHPLTNLVAGVGAVKRDWGGPAGRWPTRDGYAEGGIVDLFTRDLGGWVPNGALVRNTSGRDELMLPPELSQAMAGFFSEYPEAAKMLADAAVSMETASEWLAQAADYSSDEGMTARAVARNVLDFGIDLPGAEIISGVLDAETQLWDSRARHLGHLDNLVAKEKALEEARKALEELSSADGELSKQDQRKLDDAQKAVEEAKANVAKADSEDKLSKANEKLADSEEKLRRVREDLDDNAEESAKKHAEEVTKANEQVAKAEADLVEAKKQQVADLDNLIVLSQDHVAGMQSQANGFADQLIGMGAPAGAVSQGLGMVSGVLGSVGALAGPAGISLGMALDMVKTGISLVTTIVDVVTEIIDMIHEAHMAALQAVADAWKLVAEHASLVAEMQQNVSSLQQDIVRGLNEQRAAGFALRVAQQDRLIAEAESAVAVAEAKLALDREIERGNIAAQLRLMGLHEDWDSYLSFQALASQGMLDQWSDAAIGALFTYEAARAKALQSELSARLDQIKAESALAEVTRQNARNQADLLKAQERLIKMSAEVAGVDLVGATATAQAADIITKMAELQKQMDSNLLGRAGSFLGLQGPWSNEYRGQQAQMDTFRNTLEVLFKDYGVSMSDGQLNQALDQMKWVTTTGGDPTAVLRQFFPQLVEAEKALQLNDALSPIWDVEDKKTSTERDIEDWLSEIDLFEKTQPLEEAIKGLDYTIGGLEDASKAWASGNEDLRGEYLGSAWAKYQAAKELGVDWKLDDSYASPTVRDQIVKEVHIHLDGEKVYTADQVDELINEVLEGTNAKPVVHMDASTVADARRGVNA